MSIYKETMLAYVLAARVNKLPKYIKPAHIAVFLKDFDLKHSDEAGAQLFITTTEKKRHNYAKFAKISNDDKSLFLAETALDEQVRFLLVSENSALFNSGANAGFEDGSMLAQKLHAERTRMFGKQATLIWRHQNLDPKAYPKSFSSNHTDPALHDNIIDLVIGAYTAKKNTKLFPAFEHDYNGWGILQALDRLPPEVQQYIHVICNAPYQHQDLRFWDILDRTKARVDVMVAKIDFLPAAQQFYNNMPGNAVDMSGKTPVTSVTNPLIKYYFIADSQVATNLSEKILLSVSCEKKRC